MASILSTLLLTLSFTSLGLAEIALGVGVSLNGQSVRGVNIGGWLVLEPWITPSLFEGTNDERIIDEYTFGQYQDSDVASKALKEHWDTWITEKDFIAIADAGLNLVRIPIGYWAYDVSGGEPYIQGQRPYLDLAIDWAAKYGLQVIVDLHGAPGSQNGYDNSGQKMPYPTWHQKQSNIDRANAVIKTMAAAYKDKTSVVAIAPLNEPAGYFGQDILAVTKKFWKDSYTSIRDEGNTLELIHDAFQPVSYWKDFMSESQYTGVWMDTHIYQVFSDAENNRTESEHIKVACQKESDLRNSTLPIVVGEWSPAKTDCAKWLNGRGIGSRYDHSYGGGKPDGSCDGKSGSASTFSDDYKKFLRQYWEAQTSTYEKGGRGWVQWTWKAEAADEWSYEAGLKNGWIPGDAVSREYTNICD